MRIYKISPVGAWFRGFAAGMAGSALIGAFLQSTAKLMPQPKEGAFQPPEREQTAEQPSETVARRMVEGLMHRGPLFGDAKKRLGAAVSFGYGALLGSIYGLLRESRVLCGPLGGLAFGAAVHGLSHGILMPALRLEPPPHKQRIAMHAYMLVAHAIYGLGVYGVYELERDPRGLYRLAAAFVSRQRVRAKIARRMPGFVPARVAGRLANAIGWFDPRRFGPTATRAIA